MQLSGEHELFMHDGTMGSGRGSSVRSRLMFNNAQAALQL